MKTSTLLIFVLILFAACNDGPDVRGIPGPAEVEAVAPDTAGLQNEFADLEEKGFEVSIYEVEGKEYISQKYFVALLKDGPNQDLVGSSGLQDLHLDYLKELSEEEYVSLAGPVSDKGTTWGIVVFDTPTIEKADSLARSYPMVKAGKFEVEIYPWWVTKGGKLD